MARGLVAALLVCAFAFAGCGDQGDDGGDAIEVEEMIVSTAKSDDPAGCARLLTLHYLEQTTKLEGEAAVAACEESAVDPHNELPSKVTVSRVDVDGDSATATVAFVGSIFDRQTVRLALVRRDGQWKFHELLAFIDLDTERLVTEMGRELLHKAESPREAEATGCVVRLLGEMSAPALESLMLDHSLDRILALGERCAGRSSAL